jgi:hypothetical protein
MSELSFVLKSFAVSVGIIMLMQIKVGSTSLEDQAETWIHHAKTVKFLQAVADGIIKVSKNGSQAIAVYFKIDDKTSTPEKEQKAAK